MAMPQDRQDVHVLGTNVFPHFYNPLNFITTISRTVLGWLTINITAFTRTDHGNRYLSFARVFLGWLVLQFVKDFAFFVIALWSAFGGGSSYLGGWMFRFYTPLFVFMCVWQGWRNSRRKHYCHSLSFGTSRLMPLMWKLAKWLPETMQNGQLGERLDWWTYQIVEPGLALGLGWAVGRILDPTFGLYLQICAVALFLEAHFAYADRKNRYYDTLDAMVESEVMQAMIEGKPAPQHTGVHAIPMAAEWLAAEPLDIEATLLETMGTSLPASVALDDSGEE